MSTFKRRTTELSPAHEGRLGRYVAKYGQLTFAHAMELALGARFKRLSISALDPAFPFYTQKINELEHYAAILELKEAQAKQGEE